MRVEMGVEVFTAGCCLMGLLKGCCLMDLFEKFLAGCYLMGLLRKGAVHRVREDYRKIALTRT